MKNTRISLDKATVSQLRKHSEISDNCFKSKAIYGSDIEVYGVHYREYLKNLNCATYLNCGILVIPADTNDVNITDIISKETEELILAINSLENNDNDTIYNVCSVVLDMLHRNDAKVVIKELEAIVNKNIDIESIYR